jgi:hypothetical protein
VESVFNECEYTDKGILICHTTTEMVLEVYRPVALLLVDGNEFLGKLCCVKQSRMQYLSRKEGLRERIETSDAGPYMGSV